MVGIMQLKAKHLFRQEALDRLSSPEDLDHLVRVVKPRSWLSLFAASLLITATGVWGVFGQIPLTVTGQAILMKPRQVVPFQAASTGRLVTLTIQPGDNVKPGEVIGIIDQSALQQQLQQAQTKLMELQSQSQVTSGLQQQLLNEEIESLRQQQQTLLQNIQRERESLNLGQRTQEAIAAKRANLEAQKQQTNTLLEMLQERVDSRRELLEQQVISRDTLVQSQQDYFNAQSQLAQIEAQLRELDIQETTRQQDDLQRLNSISDIEASLKTLEAQATKLREQTVRQAIDRTNQIQELQRQIAQLQLQLANEGRIISQYQGQVLEVSIIPGQLVNPGDRLGTINVEDTNTELVGFVYFNNQDGKQIQPGMAVQVTPSFTKREQYGGIVGTVTTVSSFPVTPKDIATTVGNEDVATRLTNNGEALIQVTAQLEEDPTTESGYHWSSSNGPSAKISSGTTASVQVRVGQQAPISYILPILRAWTGING
jgi:HlyD family secretion protein